MGTSIVDGTIESIEAGRKNKKVSVFKTIVFRDNDGSPRTIKKAIVSGALADEIVPGNSGRFYLFTAFDLKGVHGLRKADGTAIYDYPGKNNKIIFIFLIVASLALIALRLSISGELPLLSVFLIALGGFGWYATSKTQRETKRQFEDDAALTATA